MNILLKNKVFYLVLFNIFLFLNCNNDRNTKISSKNNNISTIKIDSSEEKEIDSIYFNHDVKDSAYYFNLLLNFFRKLNNKKFILNDSLPSYLVKMYLLDNEEEHFYKFYRGKAIIFEKNDYIGLLFSRNCIGGGDCYEEWIAIFNKRKYKLIQKIKVRNIYLENNYENCLKYRFNGDSLILKKIIKYFNLESNNMLEANYYEVSYLLKDSVYVRIDSVFFKNGSSKIEIVDSLCY